MISIRYVCYNLFLFQKSSDNEGVLHTYDDLSDMLARFVINSQGEKIGESIAVHQDLLIVKQKKTYLGIPLKHISLDGKKLLAKGLINTKKAKQLGSEWKKSTYKEIVYPDEEP